MKNKQYMILLCCLVFLVFCISTTALARMLYYMPPDFIESWEARLWWEENRADMESSGLYASKPVIQTTPMNGLNMHGERTITDPNLPVSFILSESWTPYKPENYHYLKISISATGYGEVAFTLNGETEDFSIGHWTSEPIQKAEREVYTFRRKKPNGVVNPNLPAYDAAQISPTTVSIYATGKATTQSRRIVTYGSEQSAITAQAGSSGAGIGFIIGESSYWKWEAGIPRDVDADPYNGSYSVTINDKIRGECGIHIIDPSEAYAHAWQVNCPVNITQDGGNVYCTVKGFYRCDPSHIHQFPSSGSGSGNGDGQQGDGGGQQGNGGGVGMGQGTSNYLALGGQNGGGTPPSNGGCNTPPSNGGCNTPPPNGGCNTPPPNGGCTTTATACINPICILDTACATYTCIRSIIIGRRADGTVITEPCGELFTKCQNYLMQRGICSGERKTTAYDYHSDEFY